MLQSKNEKNILTLNAREEFYTNKFQPLLLGGVRF